jgi:hypothetical protein
MLAIIGGRRSSCAFPGHLPTLIDKPISATKDLGKSVMVFDFGSTSDTERFLALPEANGDKILVAEHAHYALEGRQALSTRCKHVTYMILNYRHYGFASVFLLTRETSWIRKQIRDIADLKFDFS